MKHYNTITDDDGQKWELTYDEALGPGPNNVTIKEFRFRKAIEAEVKTDRLSDTGWLSLPPWATVREEAAIELGFFDEDEQGDITRFWDVRS